jgi:hypothetical protein
MTAVYVSRDFHHFGWCQRPHKDWLNLTLCQSLHHHHHEPTNLSHLHTTAVGRPSRDRVSTCGYPSRVTSSIVCASSGFEL